MLGCARARGVGCVRWWSLDGAKARREGTADVYSGSSALGNRRGPTLETRVTRVMGVCQRGGQLSVHPAPSSFRVQPPTCQPARPPSLLSPSSRRHVAFSGHGSSPTAPLPPSPPSPVRCIPLFLPISCRRPFSLLRPVFAHRPTRLLDDARVAGDTQPGHSRPPQGQH